MDDWIPVEKKLPELGVRVLASDGWFVGEAFRHKKRGWMRATGAYEWKQPKLKEVRFWSPLPKGPYNQQKEEK